jgi:hypothetical protein
MGFGPFLVMRFGTAYTAAGCGQEGVREDRNGRLRRSERKAGAAMAILQASGLALLMIVVSVLLHYEILRGSSRLIPKLAIPPRSRIVVVIAAALIAHLLQIGLYALVFLVMQRQLGLGTIEGAVDGTALDFFYFSVTNFTTLGIGDLYPTGSMRIVAGLQSLNGLVLIGWSASFTYLAMEKFWDLHGRPTRLSP